MDEVLSNNQVNFLKASAIGQVSFLRFTSAIVVRWLGK